MQASAPKSLLIVDDHPVYRDGLLAIISLKVAGAGIKIVAANRVNEGLRLVGKNSSNWIVLLDFDMPGLSGLAAIKVFKALPNVSHVITISEQGEHIWAEKVISAGATMFLSKEHTAEFIVNKLTPYISTKYSDLVSKKAEQLHLTKRQNEVLNLISQGHPNKLIADYLGISEQTVKIHINAIFKVLQVSNRTQAVLKMQKHHRIDAI